MRRPVQDALREWGHGHRFAGSGDRLVIANLVFDALRHRLSLAARMGTSDPRALVFATYAATWNMGLEGLEQVLEGDRFAPEPLTDAEREALAPGRSLDAGDQVLADVPEWLWPEFERAFGSDSVAEGVALAARAPIDLRVNRLKSDRERLLKKLSHTNARATVTSPVGLRISPPRGKERAPHVQAEEGFQKGWFELQDEASQIAALVAASVSPSQVLDYCAGGGGKTLALAGEMENRGQIYAHDASKLRLAPIYDRLRRSGARNVQVCAPDAGAIDGLAGRMDLVFVDAPCSGSGVWRRRPDSKWRITPNALAARRSEQDQVLAAARDFVREGGHLLYATCSVFPSENEERVRNFLSGHPDFAPVDLGERWPEIFGAEATRPRFTSEGFATLSPARTDTDGFFIALLGRKG
jgi:16S rRNA (cytosine967-C5)-methyltransferase